MLAALIFIAVGAISIFLYAETFIFVSIVCLIKINILC